MRKGDVLGLPAPVLGMLVERAPLPRPLGQRQSPQDPTRFAVADAPSAILTDQTLIGGVWCREFVRGHVDLTLLGSKVAEGHQKFSSRRSNAGSDPSVRGLGVGPSR